MRGMKRDQMHIVHVWVVHILREATASHRYIRALSRNPKRGSRRKPFQLPMIDLLANAGVRDTAAKRNGPCVGARD